MQKRSLLECLKCYLVTKGKGNVLPRYMEIGYGKNPYRCTVCGRSFSTKSNFCVHARMHREAMPYECQMCDKGYCYKKGLSAHMGTHTNKRLNKCRVCKEKFLNIKGHMKIHTGLIQCSICNKGFSNHGNLTQHRKIHMRTHTQEKNPISVPSVAKAFHTMLPVLLRSYDNSHWRKVSCVCLICNIAFSRGESLTRYSSCNSLLFHKEQ